MNLGCEGHSHCVNAIIFLLDGKLVASESDDNTIKLWELVADDSRGTLEGYSSEVITVVFSHDSQLLAFGVNAAFFSPDGQMLVSGSDDMTVKSFGLGYRRLGGCS